MWPWVLKSPTQGPLEDPYGLKYRIFQENIQIAKLITDIIVQSCKLLNAINSNITTNNSMPSVVSPVPSSISKLNGLILDLYDFKDDLHEKLLNSMFYSNATLAYYDKHFGDDNNTDDTYDESLEFLDKFIEE